MVLRNQPRRSDALLGELRQGSNGTRTWALSVTGNWRLTFRVDDQNQLVDLNLEDYH
jgi:proteic killer suppression protein